MAKTKIHVGLEIGTSKTCMIVGEVKSDSSVKILGVGQSKSAGIRKGEIQDYTKARACVKDALVKAEEVADVEISSVFLSVTGSHICGVNNTGAFRLPDHESQITPEHVEEAKEIARDVHIPQEHVYLHEIIRRFRVDNQDHPTLPIGLSGRKLEADYHVIHGMGSRIQNSLRCVREMPLDIDGVVFAPIATAQIALNREAREAGALVLDIGGGTTDYALYLNNVISASGCIPVGGDHITNDIHLATGLSLTQAELVKVTEADASGDPARSVGIIKVDDGRGFAEAEVERQMVNLVVRARLEETLQLVRRQLPPGTVEQLGAGIFLSGGTSLMRGFDELCHEIFRRDIYRPEHPELNGLQENYKLPQFTTALGLIRYAQILDASRADNRGCFSSMLRMLWPFGR